MTGIKLNRKTEKRKTKQIKQMRKHKQTIQESVFRGIVLHPTTLYKEYDNA